MRTTVWMMVGLTAVGVSVAGNGWAGNLESANAAWMIPYGQEFWRQAQPVSKTTEVKDQESAAALVKSGVNIGDVMERVSCSFRAEAEGKAPVAQGRTYRAVYEGKNVAFSPFLPTRSNVVEKVSKKSPEAQLEKRRGDKPDPATLPSPDPNTVTRFHTVRVSVGDTDLYNAESMPAKVEELTQGNTIQRLLNAEAGLVEHWQTRREGIEVAWILQKRPVGDGSLVIEMVATGLDLVSMTTNAAHYGSNGAGRVRLSGATAVDAAGKRCALAMKADSGRIVYELPSKFLASATYPLAVDPTVSAEFGIDNPVYVPTAGNQKSPSIASDGNNYFVVWDDDRISSDYTEDYRYVYGARVSPTGALLDLNGIYISTVSHAGDSGYPSVAWNGHSFLVVWVDHRNTSADIYGARVDSNGVVLDPASIGIGTSANSDWEPSVASDGNNFLVVWENGAGIFGARVSSAGSVLDPAGIAISVSAYEQHEPSVAWNGSNFLVVWGDWSIDHVGDICGRRVSSDGVVLDPAKIVISTAAGTQELPSLASDGNNFFVVWHDWRLIPWAIFGARVNSTGVVLDPDGICYASGNGYGEQYPNHPSVAWNGNEFLVVYDEVPGTRGHPQDIIGVLVKSDGTPLKYIGFSYGNGDVNECPSVASDGNNWMVAWDSTAAGYYDIYGIQVNSTGSVVDSAGFVISSRLNGQYNPSVAWNGTNFLVVWNDDRNDKYNIYGARVSSVGSLLDPAGIAISTAPNAREFIDLFEQESPSVAWGGSFFLVVWADNYNYIIYGARAGPFHLP
jgi:hypothetical protein